MSSAPTSGSSSPVLEEEEEDDEEEWLVNVQGMSYLFEYNNIFLFVGYTVF